MSHEIDYQIHGESMQYVEIELDPEETVIAEAGTMMYMGEGITFETRMGDGAESGVVGKLFGAAKRMLTSESLFMTHFTNSGAGKARVAFASPYPGQIVPIGLADVGGEILCQKDAFLCAAKGTELSVAFSKRLGAGFFGGEGFVLQRLRGDGQIFVHAGGTVLERQLDGEKLRVDTGCIVGFESGIDYDIEMAGGLKSMMFGGEGMFLATLEGRGRVWLQSLPFARLADRVLENAVHLERKGES
ncbi:MAG: TIGR00266 family protein [Gammaproteobacteria bacterium]|nr:TIGR00266 family protein [Gammaproteobacteria bacterium]